MSGKLESTKWLIDRQADVEPLNAFGCTPFMMAAIKGHANILNLLFPYINKHHRAKELDLALVMASTQGHVAVVDMILEHKTKFSRVLTDFVLMNSVIHGHWEIVEKMLNIDPKKTENLINKHYNYGNNPFNHKCTLLHAAAEMGHFNIVQNLAKKGVQLDALDANKENALHHAVRSGNLEMVQWFCNHFVNVNQANKQGNTPLHFAMQMKDPEMVRCLMMHGADATMENKQKQSSEFLAKLEPALYQMMLKFKNGDFSGLGLSEIHLAITEGEDKALLQILPVKHQTKERSEDGLTPMQLAAHLGNFRSLLILLLWDVRCHRQGVYSLGRELQSQHHPKSKAYKTFGLALKEMDTFPQHRIDALEALIKKLDQAHVEIEVENPLEDDASRRGSTLKFFDKSAKRAKEKEELFEVPSKGLETSMTT